MAAARLARLVAAAGVLVAFAARADEPAPDPPDLADPPPPDPTAGERSDGRVPAPDVRAPLLLVPRLVLAVPRALLMALGIPVRWLVEVEERYHLYDRTIDALTWDQGRVGLRLEVDFALDFRPMAGLSLFADHPGGARPVIAVKALAGGADLVQASVDVKPLGTDALGFAASYLRRDDQVFHGIGSLPGGDRGEARYQLEALDLAPRARLVLAPILAMDFAAEVGMRRYDDGYAGSAPPITEVYCVRDAGGGCIPGTVDERLVPGFHQGSWFARGGWMLKLDTRKNASRPAGGFLLDLGGDYSHGLGDPSSYFRARGAAGVAIDLHGGYHVLVLRLAAELVLPTNDAPVPFSERAVLGGPDSLRGFRLGRFHDDSSLLASAEYRWPIWQWADGMLFTDWGGTFGRAFAGFGWGGLYPDVGAGVRIRSTDRVYLRLQVAYGFPDGFQLYLSLSGG